jgi:NOP5NT (NUC127) domain
MFVLYETPAGYAIFKVNAVKFSEKFRSVHMIAEFNLQDSILTHFSSSFTLKTALRREETQGSGQSLPRIRNTGKCQQAVSVRKRVRVFLPDIVPFMCSSISHVNF